MGLNRLGASETRAACALLNGAAGTERASPSETPAPCRSLPQQDKQKGRNLPRVLVVDEQANQARVMAIGLRVEGFDVETADSSAEALERLAAQPFDLALVDLMLPGTNGIQLARLVARAAPGHPRRADERLPPERAAARLAPTAAPPASCPSRSTWASSRSFLRSKVAPGVSRPVRRTRRGLGDVRPRSVAGAAAPR